MARSGQHANRRTAKRSTKSAIAGVASTDQVLTPAKKQALVEDFARQIATSAEVIVESAASAVPILEEICQRRDKDFQRQGGMSGFASRTPTNAITDLTAELSKATEAVEEADGAGEFRDRLVRIAALALGAIERTDAYLHQQADALHNQDEARA